MEIYMFVIKGIMYVCVRVRACVRECVRARVRVCVRVLCKKGKR